jgi:hypothetical protein
MLQAERKIRNAVDSVRQSLDAVRNPRSPAGVQHTYDDKFAMVELATRTAMAVQLTTLAEAFGLLPTVRQELQASRGNRTVTLRLASAVDCDFVDTRVREETNKVKKTVDKQKSGSFWGGGSESETVVSVVETITEHRWDYRLRHQVEAFVGTGTGTDAGGNGLVLVQHEGHETLLTRGKTAVAPVQSRGELPPVEVDITWLLNALDGGGGASSSAVQFTIDRSDSELCHTPRRNAETEAVLSAAAKLQSFFDVVAHQVWHAYETAKHTISSVVERVDLNRLQPVGVVVPVHAMLAMEERTVSETQQSPASGKSPTDGDGGNVSAGGADSASDSFTARGNGPRRVARLLSALDVEAILALQQQQLHSRLAAVAEDLPAAGTLAAAEARMVMAALYSQSLWRAYAEAVDAVEAMLMEQLVAAIGKEITPEDFARSVDCVVLC